MQTSPDAAYAEIDFPGTASSSERLTAVFAGAQRLLTAASAAAVPGVLDEAESWARAGHWVLGFVAYEAAPAFDHALHTDAAPPDGMPYALFAVFDAPAAMPRGRQEYLCGAWRDATPRADFDASVQHIRDGIAAGDFYQVNYTTRLRAPFFGDSLAFFDGLRASQAEAYCTYLNIGKWAVCSVSPELFFDWSSGHDAAGLRPLVCRPMKGTAARHSDPGRDQAAAAALRQSPKERAENLMIVDLMRNDLSRIANRGTVKVDELFSIEAWPTVWQMTSTVRCETAPGARLRDVFHALFPCGSVTGAPKAAAMSAIRTLEPAARGLYCGATGALMPGGDAVFSVGIRTAVVNAAAHAAECGIGSGITFDSAPDPEYAEWLAKQAFLRQASPEYELLETLRLHQGRYWLLRGHLARLARSARALDFDFNAEGLGERLRAVARQYPSGHWRARLRVSANGAAGIDVLPLDALPAAPRFALAGAPVNSGDPWLRHKTTRRERYAQLSSREAGIFDTLLHNERGELTEFTRGNLVVEKDGQLLTPHAECGLLPGVLRAALLARGRIAEGILRQEDLAHARRIWFINSLRGAVPLLH